MGLSGRVFHAPFLTAANGCRVVATLERTGNRTAALFPQARLHRDYTALLDDPQVELVVVNTPDRLHATMTREALEAGKHVVVEKPFVASVAEARQLLDLAARRGLILTVFQNRRYDGDFLALRGLLAAGTSGDLLALDSRFSFWRPVDPDAWREQPDGANGALANIGAHLLDQLVMLLGVPRTVRTIERVMRPHSRIADSVLVELDYAGFAARAISSYAARYADPRFRVEGTVASWAVLGKEPQEARLKRTVGGDAGRVATAGGGQRALLLRDGAEPVATPIAPGDYGAFYREVADAVRSGGRPPVTPDEIVDTVRTLQAAAESGRTGLPVTP